MAKEFGRNLTEGKVLHSLLRFAAPLLLANVLQVLYSLVDTLVVGQFDGSQGISAVTVGSQVAYFLTMVGIGFSGGGQIVVAQLLGAGNREGLKQVIGTMLTVSAIAGVIFGIIGICICDFALGLMNTPAEVFDQARSYMMYTSAGMVFVFLYNAISAVMRGLGDSTRPLIFVGIASVVNIVLDIILVGPFNMGAGGAAIATALSQGLSALFGFVYLYRRRESFVFDFKRKSFAVRKSWLKELCRMGIPQIVQMTAINLSLAYVLSLVNVYGVVASATVGVGDKITNIFIMPYQAVGTAGTSMAGQNAGAGRMDRVKQVVDICLRIDLAICVVAVVVIFLFSEQLVRIFDSDPAVIALCATYLKIQLVNNFGQSLFCAYNAACLGVGNAILSTIAFLTDGVVTRLSLCMLFTYVFQWGLMGIFWATAVAPVSCGLILGIYYYSGKWRTYRRGVLAGMQEPGTPEIEPE